MIRNIIFDIDGTLLDSVDLHAKAWTEILRRYGCDVTFEHVRSQIGKGGDQLLPVFLSQARIEQEGKKIEQERGDLFRRLYLPLIKPFPKVRELFGRLYSDGRRLALASSAKQQELEKYKRLARVEPFLIAETSSDDAEESKPQPDIFQAALKKLGSPRPEHTIVVGDTPYDAEAAGKAGIRTIGVLCGGFSQEDLSRAGCVEIYQDPADLLARYQTSVLAR